MMRTRLVHGLRRSCLLAMAPLALLACAAEVGPEKASPPIVANDPSPLPKPERGGVVDGPFGGSASASSSSATPSCASLDTEKAAGDFTLDEVTGFRINPIDVFVEERTYE